LETRAGSYPPDLGVLSKGLGAVASMGASRGGRFLPVAADADGDIAVTMFLRRGVSGLPWLEAWTLERDGQDWELLGGGAGTCQFDRLTARPLAADLGGLACTDARGRTRRNTGYGFVSYAHVRVAAEIGSVLAAGRHLTVPGHGHLAIVWASRLPGVTLVGHDRQHLATLKL